MKNYPFVIVLLLLVLLGSRKEEAEKPKVIYDNSAKTKPVAQKIDTSQIEIADLPIQIAGTNYLIHPIGDVRFDNAKSRYSSQGGSGVSYTISNYNEFEITGFLKNLKFQQVDSDSLKLLADKPVLIQTASYLETGTNKFRQQKLVYTLADADTNKDGKLDANDIKSLYISTIGGEGFTKLSADFEELIDWKIIESKGRLYFRTIEDTNKNGAFDKNDVLHYYFVDVLANEFKAISYHPL